MAFNPPLDLIYLVCEPAARRTALAADMGLRREHNWEVTYTLDGLIVEKRDHIPQYVSMLGLQQNSPLTNRKLQGTFSQFTMT